MLSAYVWGTFYQRFYLFDVYGIFLKYKVTRALPVNDAPRPLQSCRSHPYTEGSSDLVVRQVRLFNLHSGQP